MFKSLVIATDGSPLGDKAVDAGLALAKQTGAAVTILTATDPVATGISAGGGFGTINAGAIVAQLEEAYQKEARTLLAAAEAKAEAAGVEVKTLHAPRQRPADAIIAAVEAEKADTIVMGSHGRRGLGRLLLGSQAAEVLAHAGVPVLIVK